MIRTKASARCHCVRAICTIWNVCRDQRFCGRISAPQNLLETEHKCLSVTQNRSCVYRNAADVHALKRRLHLLVFEYSEPTTILQNIQSKRLQTCQSSSILGSNKIFKRRCCQETCQQISESINKFAACSQPKHLKPSSMEPVEPRQQTLQESEGRAEDTFLLPLGSPTPSTCYNCQHAGSTRLCLNSELADSCGPCGPLFWVHFCTQSMSSLSHSSALLVNIMPPVNLSRRQSSC